MDRIDGLVTAPWLQELVGIAQRGFEQATNDQRNDSDPDNARKDELHRQITRIDEELKAMPLSTNDHEGGDGDSRELDLEARRDGLERQREDHRTELAKLEGRTRQPERRPGLSR